MMVHALLTVVSLAAAATPHMTATSESSITVRVTGEGRPMILIPGFVSSGDVWTSVVDHYKGRFECHVVTVAGFAGTASVTPVSLQRVRDDVIAYVKAKKLEHPVIVGHSLGGVLAIWIAETDPSLAAAIVSVDGVPFLPALMNPTATVESVRAQASQMKALYESMTPAQLGAQSRLAFSGMISDQTKVDQATTWAETSDPKTAAALLNDLLTTDIRGDVGKIAAPLLLIPAVKAMSESPDLVKSTLAGYESQIAAAPRHEVVAAQTLHFVMLDDPAFLLKTMDVFFAKHSVARP
jgi:pimeloyl-ACP methyl ester carboxylesterase